MMWWPLTLYANDSYKTRNDKTHCLGVCKVSRSWYFFTSYALVASTLGKTVATTVCFAALLCDVTVLYGFHTQTNYIIMNSCFAHMITVCMYIRIIPIHMDVGICMSLL